MKYKIMYTYDGSYIEGIITKKHLRKKPIEEFVQEYFGRSGVIDIENKIIKDRKNYMKWEEIQ